jgi:acyl dehydratase
VTRGARTRLDETLVGKSYGASTYEVRAEEIQAYARATNDPNERYSGPHAVAGPVWPVVPAFPHFMTAARDPELGVDLRRLLHASEMHVLHERIAAGDVLRVTAELESVEHRENGDLFTIAVAESRDDVLVAEVRGTMFVRGAGRAPRVEVGDPRTIVHEHRVRVDEDQMERYARASGDHNPIHLDRRAARLAGLRAPILHGMCTMAMAATGAVTGLAGGDPTQVALIGVTFARPVVAGQELSTRFWALHNASDAAYGFETVDSDGAPVIVDGHVRLRA